VAPGPSRPAIIGRRPDSPGPDREARPPQPACCESDADDVFFGYENRTHPAIAVVTGTKGIGESLVEQQSLPRPARCRGDGHFHGLNLPIARRPARGLVRAIEADIKGNGTRVRRRQPTWRRSRSPEPLFYGR